ncbi:MAG TPA: acyl-CoA thioester hydrolase/BAAT C-terminal domain-containing protein [Paucimonas sp.]|nr:acyl-CoA thioester hydrolase/BAAT C-terminal domain-containing protein [Paucimonas sp.]
MPFPSCLLVALCLLLCQACSHLGQRADNAHVPVTAHEFHFGDGGKALYFVLDKRPAQGRHPAAPSYPMTYLFAIPGSDCLSMHDMLPGYFDGFGGTAGGTRLFILHKRFVTAHASMDCGPAFMRADHPARWLADQGEFIRSELSAARANGQTPRRVVIVGISEGAEIAPILARRIPGITHVALFANGGMDPFDAYRLQMQKHGFHHALEDIARRCNGAPGDTEAAGRSCRYWRELQGIRHTDNLLALDIPIFIAMGEADVMVPIESAWFIRDRFAAHGKTSLRLLTLPDTGHDFGRAGRSVLPQVWRTLEGWLQE